MKNSNPKILKETIVIIDEMHKNMKLGFMEIESLRIEDKKLKEFCKKIYELAEIEGRLGSLPFEWIRKAVIMQKMITAFNVSGPFFNCNGGALFT